MPGTDANTRCSPVWIPLRFFLCITRHFYVRAVIIIVGSLLAFTTWGEFSEINPTSYYCIVLMYCLLITFAKKGFLDGKRLFARRTERRGRQQGRQGKQKPAQQSRHQGEQRHAQQPRHQGERKPAQQPRRQGEQRFSWQLQAAAAPEPIVEIHRPYEPSESPSSGERETPNEPLQPAEHSDSGRNVPQSSAGPSTQSTRNTPMDVTNKEAQIYVPSQQTESSDSGNNVPQSSSDPCTHSTPLDVSNEKPRSDGPLQAEPSDLGSNVPQSSTNPESTGSASLDDITNEETRND